MLWSSVDELRQTTLSIGERCNLQTRASRNERSSNHDTHSTAGFQANVRAWRVIRINILIAEVVSRRFVRGNFHEGGTWGVGDYPSLAESEREPKPARSFSTFIFHEARSSERIRMSKRPGRKTVVLLFVVDVHRYKKGAKEREKRTLSNFQSSLARWFSNEWYLFIWTLVPVNEA